MHLRWPFVGREAELDHVAEALASRQGVVLVGDAGVGKSRLLGEAVEQAAASGLRVLHVRATRSSGSVPLGAFAPLLPVENAAASLVRAREAILAREPAVLAIDDAHALDDASAALAHQLVTQDGVRVRAPGRPGPGSHLLTSGRKGDGVGRAGGLPFSLLVDPTRRSPRGGVSTSLLAS